VGTKKYKGLELDERTVCGVIRFAAKMMESRARRKECNLKFETASNGILASRICHSRANKRLRG